MTPQPPDPVRIYTIGHSTRSFEEFLALLRAHGVQQVADIRTIPRSRRHPQFERDALARALSEADVQYRHFPGLGGLRHPRRDSPNGAWKNDSFRGYADYMGTAPFDEAVDDLLAFARTSPTTVMCAEAVWWRCHRSLLADALVARAVEVLHITSAAAPSPHRLNPMARVDGRSVTYPSLF